MLELIKEALAKVWEWIKKIVVRIVSFVTHIVSFFRDPSRLRKLREDQNRIAVAIKERLDNGDYQVVNCLYDKEENSLVDPDEDAQVTTSKDLDRETRNAFRDKDMLVVQ